MYSSTCFEIASIISFDKIFVSFIFIIISIFSLVIVRRKISTHSKIFFIYTHLLFLFLPLFVLTTNVSCGVLCFSCYNNVPALVLYSIPAALIASTIMGFITLPTLFIFANKNNESTNRKMNSFVKRYSKLLAIKQPRIYIIDKSRPVAFSFRSFRSAIFLSVGLMDILKKKEIEAVLLHELAHIRRLSSALKFSLSLIRVFSPLSIMAKFHDTSKEEKMADELASKLQGTEKHLKSAKYKIQHYESMRNL